ncbi:amidase [Rhizobium leguminosarum]|uniref:amidase family protein n=1 Tax=Rhizobium leguminosarum TaxID=384 RepID=UPI001C9129B3|nr:amidase family protein [Rhizobium leguminosarum]MBY2943832.1 amidase [Rhizobium leguminosarum]
MQSLSEVALALATGRTTSMQLVDEALSRAVSAPHAFISIQADQALVRAEASDRRHREGKPLSAFDGVPIAVKDLLDIAGTVTTAGSEIRRNLAPAREDAEVVSSIHGVGLISIGKTNLSEFAFSGLGINPHFGTPIPGYAPEQRVPGGSSSGSAIAVERGVVLAAIGSDTAGSIRVPAAFNGLHGFRPSTGRYPMRGVHPLANSFDTLGPIARSASDCLLIDQAMRGIAPEPVRPLPTDQLDLVIDSAILNELDVQPDVRKNLEIALAAVARAGARVTSGRVDVISRVRDLIATSGWLGSHEAWIFLKDVVTSKNGIILDRRVRSRLLASSGFSQEQVTTLYRERRQLMLDAAQALRGRILVIPTVKHAAPHLLDVEDDDVFSRVNLETLSLTMIGSFLDMPGFAIPTGTDGSGGNTSALFSAPNGHDGRLLRSAVRIDHILRSQGK